ncbi:hypothetical protein [Streptomyces sp. NBC_01198]|uniref:hypothetical protein n=1 Tax=Streptomyces sp. NBC_01198 TaxID=2903769 RepID=UPI002E0D570F|nr:hypothetical protein OG702_03990 [Streptomyces sp. NBC_01198]
MKARTSHHSSTPGTRHILGSAMTAAVAAALLPLAGAFPAAAAGAGASGTVVQTGGVPTLVNGSSQPAELHFDATLPDSASGEVHAQLDMSDSQFPPGGYDPWRITGALGTALCSANGGTFTPCEWHTPGHDEPGVGEILLDLPTVAAAPTVHYDVKVTVNENFLPEDQDITAAVDVTSATGTALATGPLSMHFHRVATRGEETAVYAVDKAGVLWQYRGTANATAPFQPRIRIGGGWQVYDLITKVQPTSASGWGDLVARDRSGVLWYYQGTGDPARPFAPRVRVGGGWGQYTAITSGGQHAYRSVLVARDSAGHLWSYANTGDAARPFERRVLAGHGWNIYNLLAHVGNGGLGQEASGVMGRDTSGVLWKYDGSRGTDSQPYAPRVRVGGGWQIYDVITSAGDANFDYRGDVIARDGAGKLWLYTGTTNYSVLNTRTLVGGGWQIYTTIV